MRRKKKVHFSWILFAFKFLPSRNITAFYTYAYLEVTNSNERDPLDLAHPFQFQGKIFSRSMFSIVSMQVNTKHSIYALFGSFLLAQYHLQKAFAVKYLRLNILDFIFLNFFLLNLCQFR